MDKIPEDELANYIKKYNLCHFKKVNLLGLSNVGKKNLLSYIEHYSNKEIDFEFNDKIDISNNKSLVETIKKLSITYYDDKRLDINLYITNIDDLEYIKENLDTLLSHSECIILMIDISSTESFSSISEIIYFLITYSKKIFF